MEISGETNLYCVIGDPIDHSLSPAILNRAFSDNGVDAVYTAFCVSSERLGDAMRGLRSLGVRGANVTLPHKAAVTSLADRRSPAVEAIGAANTLIFTDDGIEAHNTDAPGTARALHTIGGVSPADKRILILGGGGAARAAAYGLLEAGAATVGFAVRDRNKTAAATTPLREAFAAAAIEVQDIADTQSAEYDIVINATPIGMGELGSGTPSSSFVDKVAAQCYFDFVYHPRDTQFLVAARGSGAHVVDGLALLVAQAEASFHLWTDRHFSLIDMYATLDASFHSAETNE